MEFSRLETAGKFFYDHTTPLQVKQERRKGTEMKLPHLIALACGIALVHLLVIFLVMNGGCAAKAEKTPEKPILPPGDLPAKSFKKEKFSSAEYDDVEPVIPGNWKTKPEKKKVTASRNKRGNASSAGEEFPALPTLEDLPEEKKSSVKKNDSSIHYSLPPPSAPKSILKRGNYNYKNCVRNPISAIPGLSKATSGILLHVNSRKILWAKNPRKKVPIASMTKIMTLLLACEDVENGRVTLSARIPATKGAMALREGVVWMQRGEVFTLQKLLEATSIKSANDAAYLVAEYLGNGSSSEFILRMNKMAQYLKMQDTRFYNPHGLPERKRTSDNTSTVEDLLKLCEYAMTNPLFREFVCMRQAFFREKGEKGHLNMWNHNHLLPGARYGVNGVKGIKTGYTRKAGFCVAVSCEKDGQEYIGIVTGFPTAGERDKNMRSLLQWGFIRAKNPSLPEERIVLQSHVKKNSHIRRRSSGKKAGKGKKNTRKK